MKIWKGLAKIIDNLRVTTCYRSSSPAAGYHSLVYFSLASKSSNVSCFCNLKTSHHLNDWKLARCLCHQEMSKVISSCHHVVFANVATLKSHIQSAHCETFYKCALCPMAFKTAPGTHSHAHIQHPGVKAGEPKLIYKCSMCDSVFTQQSLLCAHFDQHVVNPKVSVFKCPDCSLHYAQKQLMLDHIKAIHGTLKTIEGPPNLVINLPLSIKPTNSNNSTNTSNNNKKDGGNVNRQDKGEKKPSSLPQKKSNSKSSAGLKSPPSLRYRCGDCSTLFSSREVFVAHMRHEHAKVNV